MLWPLASADRQWVCVQFSDDGGGPFAVLNSVSDIPSNIQLGQSIICPDLLSTRHENDDDHTTSTEYTATVKQIMDYTIETGKR
jgi:hypothetical protein